MRHAFAPLAAAALLAGCGADRPTDAEQNLPAVGEHPEVMADPGPGQPATREGPVTPAEQNDVAEALRNGDTAAAGPQMQQQSEAEAAVAVVRQFAELLEQRRFAEARQLYAEGGAASGLSPEAFTDKLDDFRTIAAAVEYPERVEGAAGSLYADVQLTLSGELQGGEPYSRTGMVTVRRVNDVPGATPDQLQWRIVKVRLGVAPHSAAARSSL